MAGQYQVGGAVRGSQGGGGAEVYRGGGGGGLLVTFCVVLVVVVPSGAPCNIRLYPEAPTLSPDQGQEAGGN